MSRGVARTGCRGTTTHDAQKSVAAFLPARRDSIWMPREAAWHPRCKAIWTMRRLQPTSPTHGRGLPLPPPERRRGGARFGDYELVAPLASGGMGGVYLARHITSGEQVAL